MTAKPKPHRVSGSVFMVTPGLFQRYAQKFPRIANGATEVIEGWRGAQKQLEKMKVHRKHENGLNIWACQVQGPRRKTTLKGYLIEKPELFFNRCGPTIPF